MIVELERLLQSKDVPTKCCNCSSTNIKYIGLGKYECNHCGTIQCDNYGKVRDCLDTYGPLPIPEVMKKTGLTKSEIRTLIERGSFEITTTGISFIGG